MWLYNVTVNCFLLRYLLDILINFHIELENVWKFVRKEMDWALLVGKELIKNRKIDCNISEMVQRWRYMFVKKKLTAILWYWTLLIEEHICVCVCENVVSAYNYHLIIDILVVHDFSAEFQFLCITNPTKTIYLNSRFLVQYLSLESVLNTLENQQ